MTTPAAAGEYGAEIRTGARVQHILISDGRARGVVLDNGQQLTAQVVVTSLHPRTAFLAHAGRQNLPDDFVQDIEHWKSRSGVVRINLALAELPDFAADPGTNLQEHHTGSVEMAPSMEYIERAVCTRAAAVAAAAQIGYPVVVKTDEPQIAHKPDVGGVRLGLGHPEAVGAAYDDLAARLGPRALVCQTAAPGTELALGVVRDPALGPLLVVSAGGVLIEIFSERAVVLPPVTRSGALAVLARLRLAAVLAGARGQPPADLGAIADIVALSTLACDLGDVLDALDINSLICGPSGAVVADVLAVPRTDAAAPGSV